MTNRPPPPVPPDLNLSGIPWLPLDSSLVNSDLYERAPADALKAAIGLWCIAWKNVPASSLPGNEKRIAALLGLSSQKWKAIREWAMAGFVLCSDDRFYHSMIAEQAVEAGKKRQRQSDRARAYWEKRKDGGQLSLGDNLLISDAACLSTSRGPVSIPSFILPNWVETEAWAGFVKMRERIKAPLTDGAMKRTIEDLDKLRTAGHDPNASLRRSEQRGWRGVFAETSSGPAPAGEARGADVVRRFAAKGEGS